MKRQLPLLILILLLAFSLRVAGLEGQSLWSDEGLSLYRAQQPLRELLRNTIVVDGVATQDTNPPFYFLLLAGWRGLVGESVFALRALNVLLAGLSVALIARLGQWAVSARAGVGAALLLALSPLHVWQTQELRNYALLVLLNLIMVAALIRWDRSRQNRWLAPAGLAGGLGIYTHYFGFLVFAFGVLALAGFWWRGRRRSLPRWIWAALCVGALALAPAFLIAYQRFAGAPQAGFQFVPPDHLLAHAASAFSVGFRDTIVQPLWRVLPAVALVFAGLVALWRARRSRWVVGLLLGYLLVPLALLAALTVVTPLYNGPRHLIMSLPPFLLLAAAGVDAAWRQPTLAWRLPVGVLAALLLFSQGHWLLIQTSHPDLVKDDWRGLARYLNAAAAPDDVVVVHDAISGLTLDAYYAGAAPVVAVPAYARDNPAHAVDTMASLGASANRVWFVTETYPRDGFPELLLPAWANDHWTHVTACRWPHIWLGVRLDVYLPQPQTDGADLLQGTLVPAAFAAGARLTGLQAPEAARAGTVWWSRSAWALPPGFEGAVSLRLTDTQGRVLAQADQPMTEVGAPETVMQLGLPVPAGLPPGTYAAVIRLLDASGQPLPTEEGAVDHLLLPELPVAASGDAFCPPSYEPAFARFGRGFDLLGYTLPQGRARPGHVVPLTLYWRSRGAPDQPLNVQLQTTDAAGQPVGQPIVLQGLPATSRASNALVRQEASFAVPALAPNGPLALSLSLRHEDTGRPIQAWAGTSPWPRAEVPLGVLDVETWPLRTEAPPTAYKIEADFGPAVLTGYDIERTTVGPGEAFRLTLVWQVSDTFPNSQIVFVHLAGQDDQLVGQGDGVPAAGLRPTTSWRPGESIVDEHLVRVRPDAAPGAYRLWVGFYDPVAEQRLPVSVAGEPRPEGRVELKEIIVGGSE